MSINDGQPVNAAVTNPAFISKNTDDSMPNKLEFSNNDVISGPTVTNIQRNANSFASYVGMVINGVYNILPNWITSNRGLSNNSIFLRVSAIDTAFDLATGHKHTGTSGDAPQISAIGLSNIPLNGFAVQGIDLVAVVGTSTIVTSQFSGYAPSNNQTTQGAVVNAPYNKLILRNSSTDTEYFDALGNIVYGRLTNASSVWTLSYYTEVSGTETPYTFSSSGVRLYFQLLSPVLSATSPVYSDLFFVPSSNATADILTATTTVKGKVQLAIAAQPVGVANLPGTSNASVANEDHAHQGIHSLALTALGTKIYGDATISAGTNVTINQTGNDFNISATGSGGSGFNPTVQKFLVGSGTYTRPSTPSPLYLKIKISGGGGGGGSGGTNGTTSQGGSGGSTLFGTSLLVANGGSGGLGQVGASALGGTASLVAGPLGVAIQGGAGGASSRTNSTTTNEYNPGGIGGTNFFGGAGSGSSTGTSSGGDGVANTGAGGGGGSNNAPTAINITGGGGGAGGCVEVIINSPNPSYTYSIGAGGTSGAAGSNGSAGGAGAAGIIIIEEYYQ